MSPQKLKQLPYCRNQHILLLASSPSFCSPMLAAHKPLEGARTSPPQRGNSTQWMFGLPSIEL